MFGRPTILMRYTVCVSIHSTNRMKKSGISVRTTIVATSVSAPTTMKQLRAGEVRPLGEPEHGRRRQQAAEGVDDVARRHQPALFALVRPLLQERVQRHGEEAQRGAEETRATGRP